MKQRNTISDFLSRCKAIRKNANNKLLLCVAVVAIVLIVIVLAILPSPQPSAPEKRIQSAEDAIAELASRAGELGYANALSELTPVSTSVSGEHTFYRLQQNYSGIPVYGQQVVYVTDAEGKCLTATHTIRDIPEDLDTAPSVSEEMVDGYVNTYICYELGIDKINDPVAVELTEENLRIYYDEAWDQFHLAYLVNWGSYQFLADAHSGQVLSHTKLVQSLSSPTTLEPSGEMFNAFQLSSGNYVMKDTDENIYLFDAGGKTYWNSLTGNLHPEKILPVTSPDNIFGNSNDSTDEPETAAEIMRTIRQIRKYYREILEEQQPYNLMVVYNDFCGWFGQSAGGGVVTAAEYEYLFPELDTSVDGKLLGMVTLGTDYSENAFSQIDVIAHEYTHVVSNWVVGWSNGSDQTKMLNEAFADIMGELVEAHVLEQDPDWQIAGRNIRDPESVELPVRTSDRVKLLDKTHDGSTIISHTAYLMWNGMDGTEAKKIPTDQLAELWYKALLMMPVDADFLTCRLIVTEAANLMDLTFDQKDCVREAFDNAEIWYNPSIHNADVAPDFTVAAYDSAYEPISRYTLNIEKVVSADSPLLPASDPVVIEVNSKERYAMHLDYGIYRFTFTPRGAKEESLPYLVKVSGSSFDKLALYYDDRSQGQISCMPYAVNNAGETDQTKILPNVQIDIYSAFPRTFVDTLSTGAEGTTVTTTLPVGEYILNIWAEGYQPQQQILDVCYYSDDQYYIPLYPVSSSEDTAEPTEPYFEYPEIVTTQNDMDYGVYPFPKDFILEEFGYDGNDMYHVYDTDTYGYDEGGGQDTITSSSPYYWWWASFDSELESQINEYIAMLEQEPFCLELIYTKDMGQEWVYVYRYTGKHEVYPLNISGFVPADAGEYHLAIDISKRADYHGRISLEVAAGYGLEPITPEILEDIRHEIGYNRTSNASENIEENETLDSGTCYFCHKTVYATAEQPIYHEQIVYCDACYAEMFGK